MKKILLLAFFTISIYACQHNKKSTSQNKIEILFKDLDLIKSKSKNDTEEFLKKNNYSLLETQFANQWKSKSTDDIIQFNDKVLVFLTYNLETYNKLITDLKKSTYKNSGKTMKNGLEVESYTRNKETIFLSTMVNPENGKKVYSLTFLS
ncbi:hypothetical protein EOD40_13175 [Flavobacterium sufflavum]|uniref:Lipoprotein n=1 Tax=Flavobacterium sufflavum TaxID=1921138 RepID=A0A437KRA0_9FLAO|nr:hypothetical protein [Flavobacterium sufflavum]RVT74457.1 hypothetical protein EOD40_13175 [Flavobacterium sufflavum]